MHGDLRVGFTSLSADVPKGVPLARGHVVRPVGFRAKPEDDT